MRVRALDADGDWVFGQGKESYLIDEQCILQNARTKLLEFTNDCFFNMPAGIAWFNLMRRKNTQNQIALSCRAVLLRTQGVNAVTAVSVSLTSSRNLHLSYVINTIFSRGVVNQQEVINL